MACVDDRKTARAVNRQGRSPMRPACARRFDLTGAWLPEGAQADAGIAGPDAGAPVIDFFEAS